MEYDDKKLDTITTTTIDTTVDTLTKRVEKLEDRNEKLTNVVETNYSVAQAIFKQNDISFKKLEKRLSHGLKFIYICIALVSIILIIMGYLVYQLHFK